MVRDVPQVVLSITYFSLRKKKKEISSQLAFGNTIAVPSTRKKNTKAFIGENKYTVDLPHL